jgi:hypothetical protein
MKKLFLVVIAAFDDLASNDILLASSLPQHARTGQMIRRQEILQI